jgi:uncharacterized protein (TIGR02145 family)
MKKTYLIIILVFYNSLSFSQQTGTFTDHRDGKTYKTIKIDDQVWMAENLNFETKDSQCYDNDNNNCKQYGRLYSWKAANSVCPSGWHLPSQKEFDNLLISVGGKGKTAYNSLKQGGDSFFSTLFSGFCLDSDLYLGKGITACFWSSTKINENSICSLTIDIENADSQIGYFVKELAFSVRCLKNN